VLTNPQSRREPRLTAKSQEFSCGYGPRSIHLSQDRTTLFVGCKDGSVTAVDLTRTQEKNFRPTVLRGPTQGTETIGARALCDLGNGWLAVGHDSGELALLRWRASGLQQKFPVSLKADDDGGAITYVGLWRPEQLLVSHRYRPAALYEIEHETGDVPPRLELCCVLEDTSALGHVIKIGEDERILISKSGLLWRAEATTVEPLDLWAEYKRPGFIFDATAVKREPGAEVSEGAYLSTDGGVFLLRREEGKPDYDVEHVNLPGFTGMCLAVAHLVQDDRCLLWVSDRSGDVHLFWDDVKNLGRRPLWRRSGILQGELPVMRALASRSLERAAPGGSGESLAFLGQACRNDRMVVTWYSEQPDEEKNSQRLSWGPLSSLPRKSGWCTEALIADYIEETGAEKPDELTEFLRNPGIDLARSALDDEILAEGPEPRASQAVTLWTHTLLGAVHRYSGDRTVQNYPGIIRWLRLLSLEYSGRDVPEGQRPGVDRLLASLERNIQYARKWGVFGRTYVDRSSILSALVPLSDQHTPDREFDRLVYESMLLQRRVDMETEFPAPTPGGKTPWDVKYLRMERETGQSKEYIAASWITGGVEIYISPRDGKREDAWVPLSPLPQSEAKPESEEGAGYSRRILLGKLGEGSATRVFLLEAPTRTGEKEGPSLRLRWIDGPDIASPAPLMVTGLLAESGRASRKRSPSPMGSGSLEEQESVYSLLELDPSNPHSRLVLVGLQGIEGRPRIGLLRIDPEGTLQPLRQKGDFQFRTPFPELRTV
jgi:hypothetical protein